VGAYAAHKWKFSFYLCSRGKARHRHKAHVFSEIGVEKESMELKIVITSVLVSRDLRRAGRLLVLCAGDVAADLNLDNDLRDDGGGDRNPEERPAWMGGRDDSADAE